MRGGQIVQHPANLLSATGYLQEYWVAGAHVVKLAVTHVIFDKKKLHYALSRSTRAVTFGVFPVTRRGAVRVISLCSDAIFTDRHKKNAARGGFVYILLVPLM